MKNEYAKEKTDTWPVMNMIKELLECSKKNSMTKEWLHFQVNFI